MHRCSKSQRCRELLCDVVRSYKEERLLQFFMENALQSPDAMTSLSAPADAIAQAHAAMDAMGKNELFMITDDDVQMARTLGERHPWTVIAESYQSQHGHVEAAGGVKNFSADAVQLLWQSVSPALNDWASADAELLSMEYVTERKMLMNAASKHHKRLGSTPSMCATGDGACFHAESWKKYE